MYQGLGSNFCDLVFHSLLLKEISSGFLVSSLPCY